MNKRIVICCDGTWNMPEKDLEHNYATNILKLARAIEPVGHDGVHQQVYYDWGIGSIGSTYTRLKDGLTGSGLHKNVIDCYRYIVQNYSQGDKLYLFGFSRGAYTIRSLCGLIYNSGILKRYHANLINDAFIMYKNVDELFKPSSEYPNVFRNKYSHESRNIKFVGVFDTVGCMGIPFSFMGFSNDEDEFYDSKIGPNIEVARHALAIDEFRDDFEPTIWTQKLHTDIKQVWFCGCHANVGGGYPPAKDGSTLSDISLAWMIRQCEMSGLTIDGDLRFRLSKNEFSEIYDSRKKLYRLRKKLNRCLSDNLIDPLIHESVKNRWLSSNKYRPDNLVEYISEIGWDNICWED